MTVTTDSANAADLGFADIKAGGNHENNEDAGYPLIRESGQPKALDQTAPLLKYEDFFKSEHNSLVEQTLLQRDFKKDSMFHLGGHQH